MSRELKHTVNIDFTVVEADTLKELSEKISKATSESGGKVKRLFALVVKTSNVPQGIE